MATVADFDGDGVADLAFPSLDRTRMRIVGFTQTPHEIANVPLPAKAATDFGLIGKAEGLPAGAPAIVFGLADGTLVAVRQSPR
jgi:hypothetical protein